MTTNDSGTAVEARSADLVEQSILSVSGSGPNSLQNLIETGVLDESISETQRGLASQGSAAAAKDAAHTQKAVFDIYVEPELKCAVKDSLETYVDDLAREGYSATVIPFDGSAAELREQLECRWSQCGLEGALFVGDLPYADFTSKDDFSEGGAMEVTYPHDLYFMDLDGTYDLRDAGPDAHTGDVAPEIYVSRITASTLTGLTGLSEEELVNGYFDKLHAFRTGETDLEEKGAVFADDDWAQLEVGLLNPVYSNVSELRDPADTTLDNYVNVLGENAETVVEFLHSWPQGHVVSGDGGGVLTSADILEINPDVGFINMFNCSSADFTQQDNLIGAYLLGSDDVVNAVGSTKTGSMLRFNEFYGPQGSGESLGQAFRSWFQENAVGTDDPSEDWAVDWFYGMTMQGDPTLVPTDTREGHCSPDLLV